MEFPFRIGHRRTRALLSSYVDGEVSAADARRVEEHASACSECRDELESLTATVELVRALPDLDLPRSFELTMLPEEEPRASFGVWAPRLATSVAGLLLVVLLAAGDVTGALIAVRRIGRVGHGGTGRRAGGPMAALAFDAPASQPPHRQAAAPTAAPDAPAQARPVRGGPTTEAATPEPPQAALGRARSRRHRPGCRPTESATPEPKHDAPAAAMKARVQAAGQPTPELATAAQAAEARDEAEAPAESATTPAPVPTWDDTGGGERGIGVPLRELQIAAAVCFLALAAVTVWRARRRRRRV